MPCYHPLKAWRSSAVSPETGKRQILFSPKGAESTIDLPCGQCIGCRLERSRQWAMRVMHEAQMWPSNSFITLTFDEQHAPADGSLSIRPLQLFFKRLRKKYSGSKIRFFACGEYGGQYRRPHYHAIVFNLFFHDRYPWKLRNGVQSYRSPQLEALWTDGMSECGDVTTQSAQYVARYCLKKMTGPGAKDFYGGLKPEFLVMSRRPGVGRTWYDEFGSELRKFDYGIVEGRKVASTKYYDSLFDIQDVDRYEEVKYSRKRKAARHASDQEADRLKVREIVQLSKLTRLVRDKEL